MVFGPADWSVPQTVTVTGVDDDLLDGDQIYSIELSFAGHPGYVVNVPLTNVDDDQGEIIVEPTTITTGESGPAATFTVRLTAAPTGTVYIPLSVSDPTEGRLAGGDRDLPITPFNWGSGVTVTVYGENDYIADGDVPYTIVLGAATGGGYDGLDPDDVSAVNVDNDTAGFTTVVRPPGATDESGGSTVIGMRLTSQPSGTVRVPVSTSDPTEATTDVTEIVFDMVGCGRADVAETIRAGSRKRLGHHVQQ